MMALRAERDPQPSDAAGSAQSPPVRPTMARVWSGQARV